MIGTDLTIAANLLKHSKLVAIPTETVYGLAANALDEKAVGHIFEIKNRPHFDPLIIHLDTFAKVKNYVTHIPDEFKLLANHFSPGPITFLLPKKSNIPFLITSGSDFVAIRIPSHPMAQALLEQLDFPLAAPSANPFGYISPTNAQHVYKMFGEKIPYILDGGECSVGLESTIIGIENGKATIFRKGGLRIEEIEVHIGSVVVKENSSSKPNAPGMLESHYAPKKPIIIGHIPALLEEYKNKKIGVLSFQKRYSSHSHYILSPSANYTEASANFFNFLHQLDEEKIEIIISEFLPEVGLGRAINDRLRRASFKR